MPNGFSKETAHSLASLGAVLVERLDDPGAYGTTPEALAEIEALSGQLGEALKAQFETVAAAEGATARKLAIQARLARALADLAAGAEARPSVTDGMLLGVGLAPRPRYGVRSKVPEPPTKLVAQPSGEGAVRLRWDKGANPEKTTHVVERLGEDGEWRTIEITARKRLTLDGFPPGIAAWFRVYATNARGRSTPCGPVGIYLDVAARKAA